MISILLERDANIFIELLQNENYKNDEVRIWDMNILLT